LLGGVNEGGYGDAVEVHQGRARGKCGELAVAIVGDARDLGDLEDGDPRLAAVRIPGEGLARALLRDRM
jgi:hypothetical protein